jgi:formylglycine-generating enzyme required for sulfatase activity
VSGSGRVIRGGSCYNDSAVSLQVGLRGYVNPSYAYGSFGMGFRFARSN